VESSATIDFDLTCIGCGYNLRTLSQGGRCPECKRLVQESFGGWGPVLASRATVLGLRRRVAFFIAAVSLSTIIDVLFLLSALFAARLWTGGRWPRYLATSWASAGALARAAVNLAMLFICFTCAPKHRVHHRSMPWIAFSCTIPFILADGTWFAGLFFEAIRPIQPFAQHVLAYSDLGAIVARAVMWFLLGSVVSREKNPWLFRLCIFCILLSLVGLIPMILVDLPDYLNLSPVADPDLRRWFDIHPFGGPGLVEMIAVIQLVILWILVRAIAQNNGRMSFAKADSTYWPPRRKN
jgi:hypothetical protein